MTTQTSMIPGEEELKKLREEQHRIRAKIEPLLQIVKTNSTFLKDYSKSQHEIYFRCGDLNLGIQFTRLAEQQAQALQSSVSELLSLFIEQAAKADRINSLQAEIKSLVPADSDQDEVDPDFDEVGDDEEAELELGVEDRL